ncbi:acyltransferase family protein [Marinobacter sp. M1N3S26]|uniref:acyltransferase family protein n=1 Tax=unclassified Marinobacter TaxID=83889 RepID=UPI00387A9AE4
MKYIPELDGIRALSALLIVLFHSKVPGMTGGFFAVDIFFVLSGFLVTQLLCNRYARSGRIGWGSFMRRRLSRLMPALAVMLVAYLGMAPLMWGDAVPLEKHYRDALLTITYSVNWLRSWGEQVAVLGHVWSLAIEMQFYLLWPLLMFLVLRRNRVHGIVILCVLYVSMTLWRGIGAMGLDAVWDVYPRTDMHATGLILGAILALLPPKRLGYLTVPGILVLAFCFTFFSTHWEPTVRYGFTLAELGAALLILGRPAWLGHPALGWLGQVSYGVYLWHFPIMLYMRTEDLPWQQVFLYGLSLALLFASLSYYLVELRFHRPIRKRRLESSAG